jgi:HlyD family secretion protein
MRMKKNIVAALVALAIVILLALALRPAPVPASVAEVERGHFAEYVEDEGRTRLRDPYVVSAPIHAYLRRVALEPGDTVAVGDVLFELEALPAPALDARTREQAREAVAAARATQGRRGRARDAGIAAPPRAIGIRTHARAVRAQARVG